MTTIEERSEYLNNPYYDKPLKGDFSPFYVTIALVSVFCAIIFILNIILGCCSKHRAYWQDRHTGDEENIYFTIFEKNFFSTFMNKMIRQSLDCVTLDGYTA